MAHALLSPSSASRWLSCTPSARLEAKFPDKAGDAAAEGTLAHALAELELGKKLKRVSAAKYKKELAAIHANEFYNASMEEYIDEYVSFVLETYHEQLAEDPMTDIFLETKVDLTDFVPEGFGTMDVTIVNRKRIKMIDLKYGKGVAVSSHKNKQLMIYALGVIAKYEVMYDFSEVTIAIHQPRIHNSSQWSTTVDSLREFAEEELIPKAKMAFNGEGELVAGDHCRFCRAKTTCKALAEYNTSLVKEDTTPEFLTDEEIVALLDRAPDIISWLKSVQEMALQEAMNGKKWPGMKLVEGKSAGRKIQSPETAIAILEDAGIEPELYLSQPSLLGITALEKNIGKKPVNELLGDLMVRPPGAPTLVDQSDKRPEYNLKSNASDDFADIDLP